MTLDCGHLFNGIGGFPLAAHWMGWNNVWHSEVDDYCNKVMAQHFPNSTQYGDIKKIDFTEVQAVDLISGGFPCQPYSQAGERRGKEDERHLWPEMLRAIRVVKPRWIVAENVYGIVNWNEGLVFEEVQAQMEDEGYEVQAYILPAASVNAPHRRDRVWFVAHSESGRHGGRQSKRRAVSEWELFQGERKGRAMGREAERCSRSGDAGNSNNIGCNDRKIKGSGESTSGIQASGPSSESDASDTAGQRLEGGTESEQRQEHVRPERSGGERDVTNSNSKRCERPGRAERSKYSEKKANREEFGSGDVCGWPTSSPICGGNDGVPNRVDRIKALGNAIVPQVAYQIFKSIEEYELQERN